MSKNSTTIFITRDLTNLGGRFTQDIRVPFIPKKVTISNLFYTNLYVEESAVSIITTDILNTLDGVIAVFFDHYSQSTPMTFNCNKPINGLVNFYYTAYNFRTGDLSFALTFED